MIGTTTLLIGSPNVEALISLIPCVRGRISAIFWSEEGMISYGRVAPEKINIGKYNKLAITPALLVSLATPPTIIPMLNIDSITRR